MAGRGPQAKKKVRRLILEELSRPKATDEELARRLETTPRAIARWREWEIYDAVYKELMIQGTPLLEVKAAAMKVIRSVLARPDSADALVVALKVLDKDFKTPASELSMSEREERAREVSEMSEAELMAELEKLA